jgi:uncharacterized protein YndB with AHSA1/START domain
MKRVHIVIDVNAPVEEVFAAHVAVDQIPQWWPGAELVTDQTAPADQPGAQYQIQFKSLPTAYEEVLRVEPNRLHERKFRQAVGGGIVTDGTARLQFEPIADGTRVTVDVEYKMMPNIIASIVEALTVKVAESNLNGEFNGFKAFVEKQAVVQ